MIDESSLCENKGADQLRSKCDADQRLCFRYKDSTIFLFLKSEISICDCTGRFLSVLVRNPEDRFSRVAAQRVAPTVKIMWKKVCV